MYKVLIADNDFTMCQSLTIKISQNPNFEVVNTVYTYKSTLNECKKNHIDILFLGSHLFGANCVETSQFIKDSMPNISIYILSSSSSKILLKIKENKAIQDILEKPITNEALNNVLDSFINKKDGSPVTKPVLNPFESLIESIENKNYKNLYKNINQVSDEIYKLSKYNVDIIKNSFDINVKNILMYKGFDSGIFDVIEKKFPLTPDILQNSKSTEIWIFKVFDFIFKQHSINRYSILRKVFIYIDEHINEEIHLNSIVKSCNISQGYLSRIFREQFGISVTEYLHMKKIHLAKTYFYFNRDSIVDVSFKLGYNESSYFSKVFKKYENMTVKEYKNLCISNYL